MTNGFGSGSFGSDASGWGSPTSGDSNGGEFGGSFGGGNAFGQPTNSFGDGSFGSQGGFGENSATSSFAAPTGPGAGEPGGGAPGVLKFGTGPWHWVSIATASAVIGLALGIIAYFTGTSAGSFTSTSFMAMAVAGWVVGGIVTFILLGLHIVEDTKRRANGPYIENSTQVLLYRAAAGVGLIAIVVTAVEIALVFAK